MITTTDRITELQQRVMHAYETGTPLTLNEEEFAFIKFHSLKFDHLFVLPDTFRQLAGGRS